MPAGIGRKRDVHHRSALEDLSGNNEALRHYEETGLLKPARVDRFTQYRYYSDEQVELVRLIRMARDTGMPLERIRDLLGVLSRGEPPGPVLEAPGESARAD